MEIRITDNRRALGESAAKYIAALLREIIAVKGYARIILSTGASQFETLEFLTAEPDIPWNRVEMFHLDEYVGLPETHPASFRKYLKERFVEKTAPLAAVHFVDGTEEGIRSLTEELRKAPVDIGLIGIGENGHIAFNDPPADFETCESYIIVNLDDACKGQQVREGWFATLEDVPKQAVSMTAYQIMQCQHIVSCVPGSVKANAIAKTLCAAEITNQIPATILKSHPNFTLYLDKDSAAEVLSIS